MSKYSDKKKLHMEGTYVPPYVLETTDPDMATPDRRLKQAGKLLAEYRAKCERQTKMLDMYRKTVGHLNDKINKLVAEFERLKERNKELCGRLQGKMRLDDLTSSKEGEQQEERLSESLSARTE